MQAEQPLSRTMFCLGQSEAGVMFHRQDQQKGMLL